MLTSTWWGCVVLVSGGLQFSGSKSLGATGGMTTVELLSAVAPPRHEVGEACWCAGSEDDGLAFRNAAFAAGYDRWRKGFRVVNDPDGLVF